MNVSDTWTCQYELNTRPLSESIDLEDAKRAFTVENIASV